MVVAPARHQKKPVKRATKSSSARKAPSTDNPTIWQRHERDIWIVLLIVVGLFAALAEASVLGPVGRAISEALKVVFGVGRFALSPILLALGVALVCPIRLGNRARPREHQRHW
jgi:uncharacterized BrkB/YihY/UPF0761 family membrane protein